MDARAALSGALRRGQVEGPRKPGRTMVGLLAVTATAAFPLALHASPAAAADSLGGLVDTYQAVSRISGATLSLSGAPTGATHTFATGDRVLLIQMTGSNPVAGSSDLGHYETGTVAAANGSTLTLSRTVSGDYAPGTESVQVVRMPGGSGTSTARSTLTALPWNGRTGGVLAVSGDVLDLAGRTIDVTGDGYSNANPASAKSSIAPSISSGLATGRGQDGGGVPLLHGVGHGGGGLGGGGGAGGDNDPTTNAGGSTAGGVSPSGGVAVGTNGGVGAGAGQKASGGAGGGGGILGGGGGGGGADLVLAGPGGGGGVRGGGGGGAGTLGSTNLAGGGGGGVGAVGNGGDGVPGSGFLLSIGSAGSGGAGGGSYGGGGASGGVQGLLSTGGGGGGGGSRTGGGAGGGGNGVLTGFTGGNGNSAVAGDVPDDSGYLNTSDPRLMMGGAGGRGSSNSGNSPGGPGGGIVFLDAGRLTGQATILADGADGVPASGGARSGSGGGGGGQVKIAGGSVDQPGGLRISVDGGDGGKPSALLLIGAGGSGGGGGAGGVWLEVPGVPKACGAGTTTGVLTSTRGGGSPRMNNPLGGLLTNAGGAGGTGLVCTSAPARFAIGDRIWHDDNADGIQDGGEDSFPGVDVSLLDPDGAVSASSRSDSTGHYLFDDLPAGDYRVRFDVPTGCELTLPGIGNDHAIDSDPSPYVGVTPSITLAPNGSGLQRPVAADGAVRAQLINPTVDAGLVCTTTSASQLGAFNQANLTDLQPTSTSPFDGAVAGAVMSAEDTSASTRASFELLAMNVATSAAGQTFGAHLHFGPCIAGRPTAAGQPYNTDLLAGNIPPEVSQQTEVWLDLTVDGSGNAIATTTVPFVPTAATRSIVIYSLPTDPTRGAVGTRIACLPLSIR